MSAVDTKPVVPAEASAVEPTPAPVAPVEAADKPLETVEPAKTEEPAKVEGEAAAAEEKKEEKAEEKKEEKVVEPITSGVLGYKAPGLKNAFRFSKRHFWFGEEAVPASSLSQYLRGEKAEVAHPVAAWSTQTGKGLLYFVKHQDQKATPAGVLNLADATDLAKDGTLAFAFKIHGHKHTFEAQSAPERNGWFVATEKAVEEAKAAKEGIVSSEGYKEQLEKLGKPATLAATSAKESSTPKKSTDVTPKPAETEAAATEEAAPAARAGSSSSSSADEDKKKKSKSKSRSVSRGKRSSIFGGFLGKKDKAEEKHEEKKEEKKEEAEAKEETPAVAEASTTAPVITQDIPKPSEELKAEEPAIVAPAAEEKKEEAKEEKKEEEKPKPAKRGSIFGSIVKGLKSPTHEKKESEVTPAPAAAATPAKEAEVAPEAPKVEETPAVAPAAPAAEATPAVAEAPKAEETKPATTTPHKEKSSFSFGKFLGGAKEKVKSPTGEKAPELPKTDEPAKTEETPAVAPLAPVEPVAEAPKEEKKEETPKEAAKEEKKEEKKDEEKKKRGSIFGSLIRNASKAGKSKKEKETANPPAKVEEAAEPKEEETKTDTPAVAATEEKKEEAPVAPAAIGDVVPDAVTVGQATKSTPPVATSA